MRYVLFSLTALFLTACGDTDNPVVSTAPAGKALQVQPSSTNEPSSRELVGNSNKTHFGFVPFTRHLRQDFTTGPTNNYWTLAAVKLQISLVSGASPATFVVEIWTTGSDGTLDTQMGTLTNPSSIKDGLNTFTGNIYLVAERTYALVVYIASSTKSHYRLKTTGSFAEGVGAEEGWSIADGGYKRANRQSDWQTHPQPYRIEIHGHDEEMVLPQSEVDRHPVSPLPSPNSGCTITYYVDADGDLVNELVEGGREVTERTDCWWKKAWDTGDPTLRESIRNQHRYEELVEDGVLPTISVSGCQDGTDAVFTFSRNGPTTENLSFTFNVSGGPNGGKTITTGFGAGNARYEWNGGAFDGGYVTVTIEPGSDSAMTGDFMLGTSSASVNSSSGSCP